MSQRKARLEAEKRRRLHARNNEVALVSEAPDVQEWIASEVTIEDPHKASTNAIIPFNLWPDQIKYLMLLHNKLQTITLKARQLGISWVTIVYCLWLCIFHKNVTILVFSKDKDAAKEIIRRARGVFSRLPNKPVTEIGRQGTEAIAFSNGSRFKAFAASRNAGTSFTATFLIVDEADKMEFGHDLYTSIRPTIADGGRVALIFTAFGEDGMGRAVWDLAGQAGSPIERFFIPWHARPGRTQQWYETEAAGALSMAHHRQEYPATPEEALGFTDLDARLVRDIDLWETLRVDPTLIAPNAPCVLAIDAGVSSDLFVAVSAIWYTVNLRIKSEDGLELLKPTPVPLIQEVKSWNPVYTEGGQVDFREPQDWVMRFRQVRPVRSIVYDPYQLVGFGQELQRLTSAREFSQGTERVQADTSFRNRIMQGHVRHLGDPELNAHIFNANIKMVGDGEAKKIRIVKRNKASKIDLTVAASMAIWELTNNFAFDIAAASPESGRAVNPHNPVRQQSQMFRGMPNSLYRKVVRYND